MTMTLALDPTTNDVSINSNSSINYINGSGEVGQRILVTLNHFYGEYFLALLDGVPWYELILGGKDIKLTESILRQAVLNVPGVLGVLKFSTGFAKRNLSIAMLVSVEGTSEPIPVFYGSQFTILDAGPMDGPLLSTTVDGGLLSNNSSQRGDGGTF